MAALWESGTRSTAQVEGLATATEAVRGALTDVELWIAAGESKPAVLVAPIAN